MERPKITLRFLAASASWLRREAVRLANSMAAGAAFQVKSKLMDGYIMRANKRGQNIEVRVLDTPALVVLPGRYISGSTYTPMHALVHTFGTGRDALLYGPQTPTPVASETPTHLGTTPATTVTVGSLPASVVLRLSNNERTYMASAPFGVSTVDAEVAMRGAYTVNPYAFMDREDRMVYTLRNYAPQRSLGEFSASGAGWNTSVGAPQNTPQSPEFSDSVLPTPLLPFCKRVSPPAYDPSSTPATTYDGAQLPWCKHLVLDSEGGSATYLLCVHVVTDMLNDNDSFGAKGLWFAQYRSTGGVPTLEWQESVDMRDNTNDYAVPWVANLAPDRYVTNNVYPAMMCRRDDGTVAALTMYANFQTTPPFDMDPGRDFNAWNTVFLYVLNTGVVANELVAGPAESQTAFLSGKQHDFALPVGMDTDGVDCYAMFFSSDTNYGPTGDPTTAATIDVVKVTGSTGSVVFSEAIPQRYCVHAFNSRFECVRYIGNGKYFFPATSNYELIFPNPFGDMAAMIYDANENTVLEVGTIDTTLRSGAAGGRHIGSIDCPVAELAVDGEVMRKATLIITLGALAQTTGSAGAEAGRTYISYDSGETWNMLADYGSPAGVRYCGTSLVTRKKEL